MILARPSTIEKAIETAATAKPPPRRTSELTMKQWRADNEKLISVLKRVKDESVGR